MELRDPIHGTIEMSDSEVVLLDSPAYQRLRAIKQLGFSEFSFPGATHNRFLHSIGVCHVATRAFDSIFRKVEFSRSGAKNRFRQAVRLAALLHDIGHGPLSHTTEEAMPLVSNLKVPVYNGRAQDRRANHEDYTLKFILDSSLTAILAREFPDVAPIHIACLIDKTLPCPDDFFIDSGLSYRKVLSQIVSSELDADRLDYLERDAYFCGTNYGRIETSWLLANLTCHTENGDVFLALNRRALYTFDDFLLARHHMHLMVYFHHKSIIYEELLMRYLSSPDCTFRLPADIEEYIHFNDYALFEHLARQSNPWATRISQRRPYRMLFELHSTEPNDRPERMRALFDSEGMAVIHASSSLRLSKYHTAAPHERAVTIFVVDEYDRQAKPFPLEQGTAIFDKYEEIRRIDRLYVQPEDYARAEHLLVSSGI